MVETMVYFLPDADGAEPDWVTISDGHITARGSGSSNDREHQHGSRIVAIAPAGGCAVEWHDVGAMPVKQARAVARLAATTGRLDFGNDLSIITEATSNNDGQIASAAVSSMQIQRWMTMLSARQISPDALVPAGLLLPKPVDGFVKAMIGAQPVARDAHHAFPAERSMVAALVGDAAMINVHQTVIEERLVQIVAQPTINLSDVSDGQLARGGGHIKRRLAVWLLLLGLLILGDPVARLISYQSQIRAFNAASVAEAQTLVPRLADVQAANKVLMSDKYALRLTDIAKSVFSAVDAVPGVRITHLDYANDGSMTFTLTGPDRMLVKRFEAKLRRTGLIVRGDPSSNANDGTRFTVSAL
jgi:general secretion pathway protein L